MNTFGVKNEKELEGRGEEKSAKKRIKIGAHQ